jgi:hypothetical protein
VQVIPFVAHQASTIRALIIHAVKGEMGTKAPCTAVQFLVADKVM